MKNPLDQLKALHNRYSGILTANEVAVYFQLFMLGNQRYWPEWIEIADWQLSLAANVSAKALPVVINSLSQKGLIETNRSRGKARSGYKIVPLDKDGRPLSNYPSNSPSNYSQNDVIQQKFNREKTEIKQKYNRNKTEIKQKLAENSPCESKAGEAPKTKTKIKTKTKTLEKEINKEKAKNVFASCSESERVRSLLIAFDEMRTKKRNPMTDKAREIFLKKLDELSGGDEFMKVHLLEQSIEHGWQSVYPLKNDLSTNQPQRKTRFQENMEAADRAIAFFESQEARTNDEGNGDCETIEAVPFGVPQRKYG